MYYFSVARCILFSFCSAVCTLSSLSSRDVVANQ
ncbi:Uncharacterized protein BM_BM570 [Brugia malayi]|uniref:Bm570 n=1 Tax=Brugia malayi TaxID=6279 RepID=A0A0K0JK06_BRUMA|nr:Uncharacterized protein BM_BM570 [Brugia malayi]CDP98061.1 Bm570 [Brugia malayi]VIO93831.1 Uncharacterized protein BM_BM570 [Brugia malayi]